MASPPTTRLSSPADWTLMDTIHDALRRDLDHLLHLHLAAEQAAMWPLARAKLTGEPRGQALLDAMEDEHQLIGPLQAVTDDAFSMDADPRRLRQLLTRLATRLTSHLAHEEADALPLIDQIMSQHELGTIGRAIRGGPVAGTLPWALASASPHVCPQVLTQLPAPRRCEHHQTWAPPAPPPGSTSRRSAKESP